VNYSSIFSEVAGEKKKKTDIGWILMDFGQRSIHFFGCHRYSAKGGADC